MTPTAMPALAPVSRLDVLGAGGGCDGEGVAVVTGLDVRGWVLAVELVVALVVALVVELMDEDEVVVVDLAEMLK